MQVSRTSPLTGNINTMELDVTEAQMAEFAAPFRKRMIQEIFPNLSSSEREFIKSGYTQEDWDIMFNEE
jgi:hypothetical protein